LDIWEANTSMTQKSNRNQTNTHLKYMGFGIGNCHTRQNYVRIKNHCTD
jgi:hypothetical protein